MNLLDEVCENCGLSFGSHHGGCSSYPYNYCPGHEGRMDWEHGTGTCFLRTGSFTKPEIDTPNKLLGEHKNAVSSN